MSDVRSKNPYELLGNDPEEEPQTPVIPVDKKNVTRYGKRDAPAEPPKSANPANARRGGPRVTGNEAALRDRNAGSFANQNKPTDVSHRGPPPAGHKNRDIRGDKIADDRRSRTNRTDTEKQVDQGWGAKTGESALDDERAGAAIAQNDEKEAVVEGAEQEVEEEDNSKSYADYLAELESKPDLGVQPARQANEGADLDKKWASAKKIDRTDEEEEYIRGAEREARQGKHRKEKNVLELDMRFVEPPRRGGDSFRGRGRGGDRGDRGGDRGDRGRAGRGGRGEFRGRGNGRGDARGAAPRGGAPRGAPRGGPHGPAVDEKNFPALGAK
ncbi:hypothetical protein FQN57_004744 [Myotisia sp. PD_48]|nr:hypothetical protein FQN57_004744 [Myotisia sp. PD_48]